ncbi:hypothetical protein D3C76_434650 [compost metagenome]
MPKTLSTKLIEDILISSEKDIEDLGFILTVIRDNTVDDYTHYLLNLLLKKYF